MRYYPEGKIVFPHCI